MNQREVDVVDLDEALEELAALNPRQVRMIELNPQPNAN